MTGIKRTPLFESHKKLNAKFTTFAGWEMPVQYRGVIEEHNTVRTAVGLFDVSHMGEFIVRGSGSKAFLQYCTPNDLNLLTPGKAQYSMIMRENGACVDDIIIYCISAEEYFLCVNAANINKDFEYLRSLPHPNTELENQSEQFAQIAVQGPKAMELLTAAFGVQLSVEPFHFNDLTIKLAATQIPVRVARTGYTGEDGVEIFMAPENASPIWWQLLERGAGLGVQPIGLAARDSLRLEACYPLYGHELTDEIDVISAGLSWVVKLGKGDFLGAKALTEVKERGSDLRLVGLELLDPGIAREGSKIFSNDSSELGWVTSGTKPPTVNKAVALGYVKSEYSKVGTELFVEVRGRKLKCLVVSKPFYRRKK